MDGRTLPEGNSLLITKIKSMNTAYIYYLHFSVKCQMT